MCGLRLSHLNRVGKSGLERWTSTFMMCAPRLALSTSWQEIGPGRFSANQTLGIWPATDPRIGVLSNLRIGIQLVKISQGSIQDLVVWPIRKIGVRSVQEPVGDQPKKRQTTQWSICWTTIPGIGGWAINKWRIRFWQVVGPGRVDFFVVGVCWPWDAQCEASSSRFVRRVAYVFVILEEYFCE